jgi:hypothetical protein
LIVELYDPARSEWEILKAPPETCWSCDGSGTKKAGDDPRDQSCRMCGWYRQYADMKDLPIGMVPGSWYDRRNYDAFAVLADVRNGTGFAGVLTSTGFKSISIPRGLPSSLSAEGMAWFEQHGGDHSDSWVDLDEIEKYDLDLTVVKVGVVSVDEYLTWKSLGHPNSWSGGISGPKIKQVDWAELDDLIKDGTIDNDPEHTYVTSVTWDVPVHECVGDLVEAVARIREAAEQVRAERGYTSRMKARLVFNFDS